MSVLDKFLDAIRLNDDYEEEDADSDSFFDEEDDDIEEKPKKRFFRKLENEDEDEEEELQAKPVHTAPRKQPAPKTTASSQAAAARAPKPAAPVSSKVTPMRKKAGALNMEVCVIKPASMEDTREIADTLLAGCTVVLNLEGIDVDIAQRIIDFCCGACYCMSGSPVPQRLKSRLAVTATVAASHILATVAHIGCNVVCITLPMGDS